MQRIKELFTGEDRAVSPVIGVILMVAITVILAAVIATFVIGLGDSTDDVSPTISFEGATENTTNAANGLNVTISIDSVSNDEDVDASNLVIRGEAVADETSWEDQSAEIAAGESITLDEDGDLDPGAAGDEILIIFESDDSSDKLYSYEVRDV